MENLIGWLLVVTLIFVPIFFVVRLIRRHVSTVRQNRDQLAQYQAELDAASARERERRRQQAAKSLLTDMTKYASVPKVAEPPKINRSYARSAVAPVASSSTSNDNTLQDLAMLYVLNTALSHGSASAQVDYDSGSIKIDAPSRSDDEDRRVVSDTFSSSDSSWSSSDSSSSSSDSGPSSDW